MVLPGLLCDIVIITITIAITVTINITITMTITIIIIIIIIIFIIVVGVVVVAVVVVHYSLFIMCYRYALSLLSSKCMVPESQTVQKMMDLCPNLGRWETAKLCQLWINKPPFGLPSGKLTELWKITIVYGKTHYNWGIFNSYVNVKLPEGTWRIQCHSLITCWL